MNRKTFAIGLALCIVGTGWFIWNPTATSVVLGTIGRLGIPIAISGVIIIFAPLMRAESPVMWVPWYEFLVMYLIVLPLGLFGLGATVCNGLLGLVFNSLEALLFGAAFLVATAVCAAAVQMVDQGEK